MEYLVFIGCIIGVVFVAKILSWPLKLIWKLVVNILIGGVLLFLANIAGALIGITLTINWVTSLITGLLGIPVVILLIVLQFLF